MNTVIILASGPSLTLADCDTAINSRLPVIAVNSTWEAVPECGYIYAGDYRWWKYNIDKLPEGPERWTCNKLAQEGFGINYHQPQYTGGYNSGLRAIMFAEYMGAKNILILGYDCSVADGLHWHGQHTMTGNPTELLTKIWQSEFLSLSHYLDGKARVFNCSRKTALDCFPIFSFEEALELV